MNSIKKSLFLIIFSFFLITSCSKEDITKSQENPKSSKNEDAIVKLNENGYLEFKNFEAFEKTLKEIESKNEEEIVAWETKLGLTSMGRLYNQALEAEHEYFAQIEKLNKTEINKLLATKGSLHSDFVFKNKESFIFNDERGTFDLNIYRSDISHLVNKYGIVNIGGYTLQYTHDYLKVVESKDQVNIELLRKTTETTPSKSIVVNKVKYEDLSSPEYSIKNARTSFTGGCRNTVGTYPNPSYRIYGDLVLVSVFEPSYRSEECNCQDIDGHIICEWCQVMDGYNYKNYFEAKIQVQRQSIVGVWRPDSDLQTDIYGSYTMDGVNKQISFKTPFVSSYTYTIFRENTRYYPNTVPDPGHNITNCIVTFDNQAACSVTF